MTFDEKIQLQVLKLKASSGGMHGLFLDQLLEESGETSTVRQMCAKVSHLVYEDLEQVSSLLNMSKREFIESAVIEALSKAHDAIDSSGVMDRFEVQK